MNTTPDLVNALSVNLKPVRQLRPPLLRASIWLLFVAALLALLAVSQGLRPDLAQRLSEQTFDIAMSASLLTGILATVAAFMVSLPDRSRLWFLIAVPTILIWLSAIGHQCLTDWVSFDPDTVTFGETARCFATLVLTSLPLSLGMVVMLRYTAALRPVLVAFTGSLAIAAFTASAMSLFHDFDATAMILMWNLGVAGVIVGVGSLFGRRIFSIIAPRSTRRPS